MTEKAFPDQTTIYQLENIKYCRCYEAHLMGFLKMYLSLKCTRVMQVCSFFLAIS